MSTGQDKSASRAQYIYKKREVLGRGKPSARRPRGTMRYGKWRRECGYATLGEAQTHMRRDNIGLYDRAIFYRGKRVAP